MPNFEALTVRQRKQVVWSLLYFMPIIGMAVDLIAPSLPALCQSFAISQTNSKNLITIYLLGYAVGNFACGVLTDAWGRRNLLRLAIIGFIGSSLLPAVVPNFILLMVARLLQGLSLGAAAVLLRAVIADILPKDEILRLGALMGTMWGIGPIVGPLIGGYLQTYSGWQAGFYFFALLGGIGLVLIWRLVPETQVIRQPLTVAGLAHNFRQILTCRQFMGLPLIMGLAYTLIIVFQTAGPFLIQDTLHYSPIFFGRLALIMGASFLISTFTGRYLVGVRSVTVIFRWVLLYSLSWALIGIVASYWLANSVVLIVIVSIWMFFASGILFPLAMGRGLTLFSHLAGTATAVMYLTNGIITSISSYFMSFYNITAAWQLFCTYLLTIILCLLTFAGLINRSPSKSEEVSTLV